MIEREPGNANKENRLPKDSASTHHPWYKRVWHRLREVVPIGSFLRNASLLAGATAISRGLVAAVSPILTRLYTAEDFGVLAVFTAILSICVAAVALRYDLAIPLPEKDQDAANLLASAGSLVLITSCVLGGGFWLFRHPVSATLGAPAFAEYMWLLPLGLAGRGLYEVLNYWAVRVKGYGVLARTRIMQGVGAAGTQVGIGALVSGPIGLLVGKILGHTAGIGSLALLVRKARDAWAGVSPQRMFQQMKRYRRFAFIAVPGQLFNNAGLHAPALLLSTFFGATVTGWFALAERVLNAPITLVSKAVQQVYFGEASEQVRTQPGTMLQLFDRVSGRLFLLGIGPALGTFFLGPPLFDFVFGEDWRTAGQYIRILSPMLLVRFVASPLSQTLNILERQGLMFVWEALRLSLVVAAFVGGYLAGLSDTQTMIAYSSVATFSYAGMYLMTREVLRRLAVESSPTSG
jgi:O-antigen/teichoic acid export membrane protein